MAQTKSKKMEINPAARDDRFFRAVDQVLRRYELDHQGVEAGCVVFSVQGGHMRYEVRIPLEGPDKPTCTCPDAKSHAQRLAGGYCKHIIGCLMRTGESDHPTQDLTFHLLDVLL